jgi:eukaryotic-like serine/threonine-protein kinase
MQQHEWEKVKDLFSAALELPDAQRETFLAESCGHDEALRSEVESLLAAHEEPKNVLEQNTYDLASKLHTDGNKYLGRRFGPYSILREIGRGGMGSVFLAARADGEFDQQVALKIIRQSFADQELERHFRRERQILASLNHPNIAKLMDGGVSETGELFLAMEFIEGEPLVAFAQQHQLTIERRLRLFLKICDAVSFAHQNLVIHRDLKPSNILVTEDGTPKLLDFGLAKLAEQSSSLSLASLKGAEETQTDFRAFTPAYASPEQILGKSVATTSDVFSLGVILYELLTNKKPFQFEGKSLEEIIRTVSKAEASLPSRVVSSGEPEGSGSQRQLRGDLDNITLKALQKEPSRRYQSVAELASDIERHLGRVPIAARPNTLSYRASRFYQRNKIAVSATALIVLALIVGLGIALRQYSNARRENAKAEAVNAFLQKMLKAPNSQSDDAGKGYQTTVNEILADAEKRLDGSELSHQPEVRAELRRVIGAGYAEVGNYAGAEKNLRQALIQQTQIYGDGSPKLLRTEFNLAGLFLAKADYEDADKIYTQRFSLLRKEFQAGNIEAEFFVVCLGNYALLRRARGDSLMAEALLREDLALSSQYSVKAQGDFAGSFLTLILLDQGKFNEAAERQQAAVARYRTTPANETAEFGAALTLLGSILMEQGDLTAADANLREAERLYRKLLGPNHISLYDNLRLQAQVSYLAGKYPEGLATINEVLENYRQNSSPKYISFATALTVKGLILNKLGGSDEAEKVLREAVKLREENLPEKHFMTALSKGALGEFLVTQKHYAEAEGLLLGSYEGLKNSQSADSPRIKTAAERLVKLYADWGRPGDANNFRSGS